jgi:hypothetical protein
MPAKGLLLGADGADPSPPASGTATPAPPLRTWTLRRCLIASESALGFHVPGSWDCACSGFQEGA